MPSIASTEADVVVDDVMAAVILHQGSSPELVMAQVVGTGIGVAAKTKLETASMLPLGDDKTQATSQTSEQTKTSQQPKQLHKP